MFFYFYEKPLISDLKISLNCFGHSSTHSQNCESRYTFSYSKPTLNLKAHQFGQSFDYFRSISICFFLGLFTMLFFGGLSSMVYELLRNCFVPYDFGSGFDLFFEVHGHITQGHIPLLILHLFFAS